MQGDATAAFAPMGPPRVWSRVMRHVMGVSAGRLVVCLAAFVCSACGLGGPNGTPVAYEILEDPTGRATIEDVTREPLAAAFRTPDELPVNLGLTSSTWWLRLEVDDQTSSLVQVAWPLIDAATLYYRTPDGRLVAQSAGRRVPIEKWPIRDRFPTFRLSPDGSASYYLRVSGRETVILPLTLWTESAFVAADSRESAVLGFYFGLLFVMTVSGLLVWAFLRDLAFLSYAAFVGIYGLWQASFDGILSTYVWPDAWWWTSRGLHAFGILCVATGWIFARTYLRTRASAPGFDRVFRGGLPVFLPLLAWALLLPGVAFVFTATVVAMGVGVWTIAAGVVATRTGSRAARYFLAAWAFVVFAALAQALRDLGLVESNPFTEYGMQVGFVLTFGTLLLGLIARILGMRDDLDRRAHDVQRLEREDAAKRAFLATASHDLRQPLHAVGLLLGALGERLQDREATRLVEKIQSATNEMADMFNGLLDISRLDAGMVKPEVVSVDLEDLFERLEGEFGVVAAKKGISLVAQAEGACVASDPLLLSRILRNLLSNALRYTDAGEIRLGARATSERLVEISVSDTGRGISESEQTLAFDAYRRLAGASDAAPAGLGLGLSIVQRLADLLDHDLRLSSTPGRGTTVVLTLARAERNRPVTSDGGAGPSPLDGLSVLVVDDDASVRDGMRVQLEAWGCRVRVAGSADDAARIDAAAEPQLVLADYHVGTGPSGIEIIEQVRRACNGEVAAVLVTGDSSGEPAKEAARYGVTVLTKPVPPARLRTVLNRIARELGS